MGDVDFNEVNRNIKKDKLDINHIRIIYGGLTSFEADEIVKYQRGERIGNGKVLSHYPENLDPLYKGKAKGVITLEA